MSCILSESLATLAGDVMAGQVSPETTAELLLAMAKAAHALETEVNCFRMIEGQRGFARALEAESLRSLHELARFPASFRVIRTGADIVPLRPKTGGRDDG